MDDLFFKIAEARIKEAIRKGELKDLPGEGQRLILDDPSPFETPEERTYNKMMKNLGLLPVEVLLLKEIERIKLELKECQEDSEKVKLKQRLEELELNYKIKMDARKSQRKG